MPRATRRSRAVAAIAAFGLFIQTTAPMRCDGGAGRRQTVADGASARAGTRRPRPPPRRQSRQLPLRRSSTAAGRESTTCRAAGRCSSISLRWRAGRSRNISSPTAPSRSAPRRGDKPAIGTIKIEAETEVSVPERLVSFQKMKIVEANFQTLQKEQIREITTEIDKAIPDDERIIALDRVLANLDKSQVIPKNVEGVKADPPTIFFSTTPAVIMNLDGEPIWSPIKENDLKFAVNTNWDLFQYTPTSTLYLRNNDTLAQGDGREGAVVARGQAARQLREAAGGRELEGRQGEPARQAGRGDGSAEGVRQPAAGGAHPADGRARVSSGARAPGCSGSATPRATCSGWERREPCITSLRAAGSRRRTSPGRGRLRRRPCRPTSRRFRSSTSARASSRLSPEPIRRSKPCSSRRFRRPLA